MSSSILYLPSSKIENQKKIGKKGKIKLKCYVAICRIQTYVCCYNVAMIVTTLLLVQKGW